MTGPESMERSENEKPLTVNNFNVPTGATFFMDGCNIKTMTVSGRSNDGPQHNFGDEERKSSLSSEAADCRKLSCNVFMFHSQRFTKGRSVFKGYKAHGDDNREELAIKLLDASEKHKQEITRLLELPHHLNIVKMRDSGKLDEEAVPKLFLAMELCQANLHNYIRENPLTLSNSYSFFKQIVSAVVHIHTHGIAHRDLKPSNILVSLGSNNEIIIKLSDFGISKDIPPDSPKTITHPGAGTEGYMSPEAQRCEQKYDLVKADIFSLAITGYHIFTNGKHPFGEASFDWPSNIANNKSPDLSGIPKFEDCERTCQLTDLLKAMLSPQAEDRPSAHEVKKDMFFKDRPIGDPHSPETAHWNPGVVNEPRKPVKEMREEYHKKMLQSQHSTPTSPNIDGAPGPGHLQPLREIFEVKEETPSTGRPSPRDKKDDESCLRQSDQTGFNPGDISAVAIGVLFAILALIILKYVYPYLRYHIALLYYRV